jgi:hypothetical protein
MFPSRLSNEHQAIAISKRNLRSLKKDGQVKEFEEALQKFIDQEVFKEMSREEMEQYDVKGLPSNFISIQPVEKKQSSGKKLALRIVTNSSLNRTAVIGGKEVQASLNSVLPKASPQMNSLVNITLQWLQKPVSVLVDQQRAYHVLKPEESEDGLVMTHLRRVAWFKNPYAPEDELKLRFFRVLPMHFGDSPASHGLNVFRQKVVSDLRDEGKEATATKLAASSFVDDNACSVDTVQEAFEFYEEAKQAFNQYGAELHEAVISSRHGRFDCVTATPRTQPGDVDEEEETRIFGWLYNSFTDHLKLPLQRNINRKKKGIRIGVDLTEKEVDTLKITQRSLASFQMSIHDYMGLVSILTVRGKVLLAEVQKRLPPNLKDSWDCDLPQDLLDEARDYIKMMVLQKDPVIRRSPPPGTLDTLFVFVDGAEKAFGVAVWGRWTTKEGCKESRFLYAKPKVGRRTIPDQELTAMNLGTEVVKQMMQCLSSIKEAHIFGDSSATQHQIKESHVPRDVFKGNKYNSINANLEEIRDKNVVVKIHLVPSKDNAADPVSKFIESSPDLLQSTAWLEGPSWINCDESEWPTRELQEESAEVSMFISSSRETRALAREDRRRALDLKFKSLDVLPSNLQVPSDVPLEVPSSVPLEVPSSVPLDVPSDAPTNVPSDVPADEPDAAPVHLEEQHVVYDGDMCDGHGASYNQADVNKDPTGLPAPAAGVPGAKLFTPMLSRVSKVRIGIRSIARIVNILRKKTFTAVHDQLSANDEHRAWHKLVTDQADVKEADVKGLMAFQHNGTFFTKQRWSVDCHRQLFNCDALPVIKVTSNLGALLVKNAHTAVSTQWCSGPCRSNEHVKLHLRTSDTSAYLTGNLNKAINFVRSQCVNCRKEKIKIKNGTISSFCPQMCEDRFKDPSLSPFQAFSCDLIGPILTTDRPNAKQTRTSRCHYVKKWILIVVDCSAIRAVKYVVMADQSAAAFCQALQTCFAETGTIADRVYTDSGSQLLAVARKERKKSDNHDVQDEGPNMSEVKSYMKRNFPNIQFEAAGSSSQYKNALSEVHVKISKKYIRNVLSLKPNATLPKFTNEGLYLLLKQMALHLNQRPLSWCGSHYLTANHFINPRFDVRDWTSDVALANKFTNHENYKQRMRDELVRAMQTTAFLPGKWLKEGARAETNDIVLVGRGASKYGQGILEYAQVNSVSADGRMLQVSVARVGGNAVVKALEVDARNCHLILRPDTVDALPGSSRQAAPPTGPAGPPA